MVRNDADANQEQPRRWYDHHEGCNMQNRLRKCSQFPDKDGFMFVVLEDEHGDRVCRLVHELVAETLLPNPEGKTKVRHKDGNKKNNSVTNLEWCE